MDEDSTPAEVNEPVIRTREDLANALLQQFLGNSDTGDNAANDELVQQLGEWQRKRRSR